MRFQPGFIAPPWPHTRGDSTHALSLVTRILDDLGTDNAEVFKKASAHMGFHLVTGALDESRHVYNSIMNELRSEQL